MDLESKKEEMLNVLKALTSKRKERPVDIRFSVVEILIFNHPKKLSKSQLHLLGKLVKRFKGAIPYRKVLRLLNMEYGLIKTNYGTLVSSI